MLHDDMLLCSDATHPDIVFGLLDFTIAPPLLLYAYVPAILLSLLLGFFIARNQTTFLLPGRLFLLTTILFSVYLINDILQWVAIPAPIVHFSWQLILLIKALLLLACYYFIYTFVKQRDLPFSRKVLLISLLAPILVFLPTTLNIAAFNLTDCEGESGWFYYYIYLMEAVVATLIIQLIVLSKPTKKALGATQHYQAQLLGGGALAFILFLFGTDFIGEYTGTFEILLIAPLGMLIFLLLIAFLIVRYSAFNMKLLAAQALIVVIVALVGSQLFFIKSTTNFVLTTLTLLATTIAGYYLVRSVKREVEQREEIQELARLLGRANDRLTKLDQLKSEFVSIASHQLRSPLAAMRGYASMLSDGSYGKLPTKAQEAAARIEESSRMMAQSVEDYLNVSRIEAGHMKYNLSDFSLREVAEHIADDIRPLALRQGVVLLFKSIIEGGGEVRADKGKVEQIVHNLINNALKYTPKGTITIVVRADTKSKKVFLDIQDTGIGMTEDTLEHLFSKFERGKNANSTNIQGTGLGLYTALKLAEAMGGSITAHSDGEGKGSRFTLAVPTA
jgi:signal transduction histidine kinase